MPEITLQIFEGSAVFTEKIVAAPKTETHRGNKRDLTTQTRECNKMKWH